MQSLLARVGKTAHPNDMLAMLSGIRSPPFKHGLLLTLQRGTYAANATSCAPCPEGYYCPGGAPLPTKCKDVSSYCPAGSTTPKIAKAGTYTNPKRTATIACEEGYYCSSGRRLKCPSGSYCPAGVANHIVVRAGMYTNANQTNATFCEPGYYCKNGIKHNCKENYYGESHNLTSDICDGACGSFLEPNDSHTNCVPSLKSFSPLSSASFLLSVQQSTSFRSASKR